MLIHFPIFKQNPCFLACFTEDCETSEVADELSEAFIANKSPCTAPTYHRLSLLHEKRENNVFSSLLFTDDSNFIRDRLYSFAGRQSKLTDISQRIQ
jgi:hypothetical protein